MPQILAILKRAAPCLLALAMAGAAGRSAMAALADEVPPAQAACPQVRAACSVHLFYQAPQSTAFYNEITVEKSVPGSYFMACGFQVGYFGMQELTNGKKVVIFSVWDEATGNNPNAVDKAQQAEVLYKGDGVRTQRFGGEGTGQKSMWDYDWKNGEAYRFLLKAVTVDGKPSYAAYFFVPETKSWKHLATFHTPHNSRHIGGYYSFVEDFRRDVASVGDTRRAVFANGAVCDAAGAWQPLDRAYFGASTAANEAREQINAGPAGNGFFLQTGGDTQLQIPVNSVMTHDPAAMVVPADLPQD